MPRATNPRTTLAVDKALKVFHKAMRLEEPASLETQLWHLLYAIEDYAKEYRFDLAAIKTDVLRARTENGEVVPLRPKS